MDNLVQLNVRIDREVKELGESRLELIGLTPTEFMRLIWARLADEKSDLSEIEQFLNPESAEAKSTEHDRKLAALHRLNTVYAEGLEQLGISGTASLEDVPDKELLTMELEDRMNRRMGDAGGGVER